MIHALRQKVIVKPGGVIEIQSPELPVGIEAEVIVIIEESPAPLIHLVDLIGAARGGFATPAEADAFLDQERASWES